MNGNVDDDLRALLEVRIGSAPNGSKSTVLVWVDTAFNGGLVLPRQEIRRLGLKEYSSTPAILADGQQVELPTYTCYLDWFGASIGPKSSPTKEHTPCWGPCYSTVTTYT